MKRQGTYTSALRTPSRAAFRVMYDNIRSKNQIKPLLLTKLFSKSFNIFSVIYLFKPRAGDIA